MMGNLDFDVIGRSLPYLLKGLQYTVQLTLVAALGGTDLRHAAGDGSAVSRSSRWRSPRQATST